ncbi:MAG: response regulator transcription factor [Bdellovibrionia bacterium]
MITNQSQVPANKIHALVVEDDLEIASIVRQGLEAIGAQVDLEANGRSGLQRATQNKYDIVVLDMMMPEMDGFQFLESYRQHGYQTPLLILSALRELDDRLRGLQMGGDDYMTKPFAMAELQIRVQNLIKRANKAVDQAVISFGDIKLDRLSRDVFRDGKKIDLQEREFMLLELFLKNPNKIIGKSLILKQIWDYDFDPQTNIVDVLVCRLRNKLEKDFPTRLIYTVRGVGYVLKSTN